MLLSGGRFPHHHAAEKPGPSAGARMTQHRIPAQYASYGQPRPLKPYQPCVAQRRTETLGKPAAEKRNSARGGLHCGQSSPPPRSPNGFTKARPVDAVKPGASGGSSKTASNSLLPSSTPHAPRQKLDLIACGCSNLLPSTHDLLRKHTYIDSGHLRVVKQDAVVAGGEREREEEGRSPRPVSWGSGGVGRVKGGGEGGRRERKVRKQAWQDGSQEQEKEEPDTQALKVQPFRRTVTTAPPDGIPLLNLGKLNEPDHMMEPIELIRTQNDGEDTARSEMSWGVPFSRSPDPIREEEITELRSGERGKRREGEGEGKGREAEVVEEIEEEITENRQVHMDSTHARFVEEKILSHERAISSLSPHPPTLPPHPSPPHTSTRPPRVGAAHKVGVAMQSHVTFGLGVSETDLSRRLRFEARVLTLNGRDVHRELCGFYFLADSSITVYEFRQFGKKSSALPLVQRKVYCHQVGHKKGEPYQINFIRKGSTLHFPTSALPSLPDYMTSRPLLSLRITQCSERDKRQLLCANRIPMECVSIDSYLQHPLSPEDQQDWTSLRTLQEVIRRQLLGRASKTLIGLGRLLLQHHPPHTVDRPLLRSSLHSYHVLLNDQDFDRLWKLLTKLGEFGAVGDGVREGGGEGVRTDRCIAGLAGEMNEERKAIVRKVFRKLDTAKSGLVSVTSIRRFYRHASHDIEGVWFDHTHRTPLHTQMDTINYSDFENYYEGISIETKKDSKFIADLKNTWTV